MCRNHGTNQPLNLGTPPRGTLRGGLPLGRPEQPRCCGTLDMPLRRYWPFVARVRPAVCGETRYGNHSNYQAWCRKAQGRTAPLKTVERPSMIQAIAEGPCPRRFERKRRIRVGQRPPRLYRRPHHGGGRASCLPPKSSTHPPWMPVAAWFSVPRWSWKMKSTGTAVTYQIVGEDEADFEVWPDQRLQPHCPRPDRQRRGRCGRCYGPGGERSYEIVSVKYI